MYITGILVVPGGAEQALSAVFFFGIGFENLAYVPYLHIFSRTKQRAAGLNAFLYAGQCVHACSSSGMHGGRELEGGVSYSTWYCEAFGAYIFATSDNP